jgi:hypothetical protein
MHKPRYLSDEEWSSAWGISWYAVRTDGVTWVQHSGGLPGFTSNACFDRSTRVGAIVLLNGIADASALAMSLAAAGRELAEAAAPQLRPPAPTPPDLTSLLGIYSSPDLSVLVRLEWRDGELTMIDASDPGDKVVIEHVPGSGRFVVAPGVRQSGETVEFRRLPDGAIASLAIGGACLVRLGPLG